MADSEIDLRAAINAVSDVVQNRPRPLREFDQIYMKSADMVLQSEIVVLCDPLVHFDLSWPEGGQPRVDREATFGREARQGFFHCFLGVTMDQCLVEPTLGQGPAAVAPWSRRSSWSALAALKVA